MPFHLSHYLTLPFPCHIFINDIKHDWFMHIQTYFVIVILIMKILWYNYTPSCADVYIWKDVFMKKHFTYFNTCVLLSLNVWGSSTNPFSKHSQYCVVLGPPVGHKSFILGISLEASFQKPAFVCKHRLMQRL